MEHNTSSSEELPVLVRPSCSVANKLHTSSDLVQPSHSVANKVRTHQHSGAVFCASIFQCCFFKLTIAYSVLFYSLIHFHHQKATMEFSTHQDMDEEDNKLLPGDGGSAAQLPPALAGIGNREGVLAYEENNTLFAGDWGSDAQLFPELNGIGNGERKSLPSKTKKRIPPNTKKMFGRTKMGKNKNSPVAQVNTINSLNATPMRSQRPRSDDDDLAAGSAIQEITKTQLLRKAKDLLQTKKNNTEKISELQSKIGQLQRDAYDKDQVIDSMIKEHFQDLEGKDSHKDQVIESMIKEHVQ